MCGNGPGGVGFGWICLVSAQSVFVSLHVTACVLYKPMAKLSAQAGHALFAKTLFSSMREADVYVKDRIGLLLISAYERSGIPHHNPSHFMLRWNFAPIH